MKRFFLLFLPLILPGCASYYSHYAMFPAENSAGESRQIRVSWQTAEYPDWWLANNKATPIRVETQCSDRVWRLRDEADEDAAGCGVGIRACGEPGVDVQAPGGNPVLDEAPCMVVDPSNPDARIAGLGGKLELLVSCRPVSPTRGQGDEKRNLDYLRASPVPYTVYARKAPRGSLRAKMPEFDESACDAE
ncbi:hypothetical protein [Marinobacter sp. F4206]|uniref:hypothetical protein n=1 Tax=Marinobacter sp. F4206 TaxID=2861777 RepID=UPI001C5D4517|nr:hypothetical protein [Marinobacter sp. F4206]MBW4936285.1 hypothetical protein [Marinobacter sp. F4206]